MTAAGLSALAIFPGKEGLIKPSLGSYSVCRRGHVSKDRKSDTLQTTGLGSILRGEMTKFQSGFANSAQELKTLYESQEKGEETLLPLRAPSLLDTAR